MIRIAMAVLMLAGTLFGQERNTSAANAKASPADDESFRSMRVVALLKKRDELVAAREGSNWTDAMDTRLEKVDEELRKYPAPENSNSAALSKLLPGKWQSAIREYNYKPDGSWSSPPLGYEGVTRGTWAIVGNCFNINRNLGYTIILLTRFDFVYMDRDGSIHCQKRM